jgi:hypothetical protein
VYSNQIDCGLLVADQMGGLDTDIVFLDHRDELDGICEDEEWFLFLVVTDLARELGYIGERSCLELILFRYCTIRV